MCLWRCLSLCCIRACVQFIEVHWRSAGVAKIYHILEVSFGLYTSKQCGEQMFIDLCKLWFDIIYITDEIQRISRRFSLLIVIIAFCEIVITSCMKRNLLIVI